MSRVLACRWCGEQQDVSNRDVRSGWTHSHSSRCPYRNDRVPALNGVHVGDLWQNRHTRRIERVVEIRLGGCGTYTDREAVYVCATVWEPSMGDPVGQLGLFGEQPPLAEPTLAELEQMPHEDPYESPFGVSLPDPMWVLVEHADPLTRPGEYPVPFELRRDRRSGRPMRWVVDEWRGPAMRGGSREEKGAYFHAWHRIDPESRYCSTGWEWWQIDPSAEGSTLIAAGTQLELIAA